MSQKIDQHGQIHLSNDEILRGYDEVVALYPYVPPISIWRAWECAAYRRLGIDGRILDLGCGDGRYFRLIWPHATNVIGVDSESTVAELGRQSGVYEAVHLAPAHEVPEPDATFDHVFANCSLEHMDQLDAVLSEVHRCLKRGGTLVCSVVTDRFVQWSPLSNLATMAGLIEIGTGLQRDFLGYHHLVNPLSAVEWKQRFANAGLIPEIHIPILPAFSGGIFLLMDSIWHIKQAQGQQEIGAEIYSFLSKNQRFPGAFRSVIAGLLDMEMDWQDCCGAVFVLRKSEKIA